MVEFLVVLVIIELAALAGMAFMLLSLLRKAEAADLSPLQARLEAIEKAQERAERVLREEMARGREESGTAARGGREELANALKGFTDTVGRRLTEVAMGEKTELEKFSQLLLKLMQANQQQLESVRAAVEVQLKSIQADNNAKLEQMRATVDEKLQGTLEKRLGDSFRQVSDRLEQVHKGLGEMQSLASGVGDLKKVLTNVKTRGTWGEIQLGSLLEQILTPDQYGTNVATRPDSGERVEFAIRMPGKGDDKDRPVWLPIDAKFPQEDYQRLLEAQEAADPAAAEAAGKALELRIKACAKDIHDKYICPPHTIDYGILYLPTEGLFAEVVRRVGLVDLLQREYRVNVAGPTTVAALLNSLQMGFRTLAIEQRSSEVWRLLGAVKGEFAKYGDLLDKVHKKLDEASNTIEAASTRTRAIERRLRTVDALPADQIGPLLPPPADEPELPA